MTFYIGAGGGKTAVLQMCSTLDTEHGTTLLVVPRIAIKTEMMQRLTASGFRTAIIGGESQTTNGMIVFRDGELDFAICSPNSLVDDCQVQQALWNCRRGHTLRSVVIDEAQLVSEDGFDFMPQYLQLGFLKKKTCIYRLLPCLGP